MSKLILSDITRKMEKYIPRTINGSEISLFLGFDNSLDGTTVIRIEMKIYKTFSFKYDGRSFSIIPFDEKLSEEEDYQKYIYERIESRVKERIFGVIEFLNEYEKNRYMEEDKDESE